MQEFLQYDFVKDEILTKLSPLSLYNLKFCDAYWDNRITLSIMKESIIREINTRLSLIIGDNYDEFNKILDTTKAVISGSFIIQCVLGEHWVDSDIDIYFPTINNKKYLTDCDNPYYKLEKFLYETVKFHMNKSYSAMHRYKRDQSNGKLNIEYVRNYETPNNRIQVIQVKIENDHNKMREFMYDTADFDICKNVYYIDNGKKHLNMFALNDILNRKTEFKIGYRVGSSLLRYDKYTKRGFNIINNMSYMEIANKAIKNQQFHTTTDDYNGIIHLYHMDEIGKDEYKVTTKKLRRIHPDIINLSGDLIELNGKYLTIVRKNDVCHNDCLMRFCKSNQKHICYDTKYGQYIFVIQ